MKPEAQLESYIGTGNRALGAGDLLTAQNAFSQALAIDRDCVTALSNMSVVMLGTERLEVALAAAARCVELQPSFEIWNNYGYILGAAGHFAECEVALRKALTLKDWATTWHSLGLCLYSLGRFTDSVAAFSEALRLEPGNIEHIDKRAISMLGEGRYVEGLIDNKVRWECVACHPFMHSGVPEWHGESLRGKSIAVLHEQGFGDTFQFIRFVPRLKDLGAERVVLSVPESAVELFKASNLADEVLPIRELPDVNFKCPMMTVPAHTGVSLGSLGSVPYLKSPVRDPMLPAIGRPRVGLVWAGKPMYAQDNWRSMSAATLLPIVSVPGVDFYSLQADERGLQLAQSGLTTFVTDLAPIIKSWSETAAIVRELDLLVAVDTAPAHLAGAMNVPVSLMIPEASCWRWLGHDTMETPWYPSMTLHRQQRQGDWTPVIEAVKQRVKGLADQSGL